MALYDDPDFLAGYLTLDRQVRGLDGAAEWPTLRSMLPDLDGRRVLDLGCGFGWFSRFAAEHGAASVVGVDVATTMLARARSEPGPAVIDYWLADLDRLELPPGSFDMAFSSLTLHYVHDLDRLLSAVARALSPGGVLVFSVEHPILSAPTTQEFVAVNRGDRVWPLDRYLDEGERVRHWYVDGVTKHHRTLATYVNALIECRFVIDRLDEWGPSADAVAAGDAEAEDRDRPWFLLVRAHVTDHR